MANDYLLSKYYAGAATSPSAARAQGGTYGLAGMGASANAASQRKRRLEEAIASGRVKASNLGTVDAGLLGVKLPNPQSGGGGGGILGGIGHFIGNFGSDVWQAGKYLPAGVYTAGKSILHDVAAPLGVGLGNPSPYAQHDQPKSEVLDKLVKPTLAGYGDTYGHGPGHFLQSFYEHPLGPILDAASVVSLGASGAARAGGFAVRSAEPGTTLSRLGEAGVNLTSRGGRAPFVHPDSGLETPREYTPRPVAKLGQRALDAVMKTGPDENRLGSFMRSMDDRKTARWNDAQIRALQNDQADAAIREILPITKLTPDEAMALTLAQKGVNTPERITAFQRMVHDTSIDDPAELEALTNRTGVSEQYIRHVGKLDDRVKQLILQPSDRMIEAHVSWKQYVKKQQEDMGLTDEIIQGHLQTEKDRLRDHLVVENRSPAHVGEDGIGVTEGGVRLTEEQSQALFGQQDSAVRRQALDSLAHNPTPGTVVWRGDKRPGENVSPEDALNEGMGIHWTVSPDSVLNPFPNKGTTNIVWEAVLDHPADQVIPRSRGDVWGGKYRSAAGEVEVRVRPQARLRVVGAYVYTGAKDKPGSSFWQFNSKKGHPNWKFVPVHATTDVRHLGHATLHPSLLPEGPVQAVRHTPIHEPAVGYPIEHTYVPSEAAKGFEEHKPSRLAQSLKVDPGLVDGPVFRRGPLDTAKFVNRGQRYDQTLFVPRKPAHEYASTGETFASGALRTDARLYLDHVARRARDNSEELWKQGEFQRIAARDSNGDTMKFANQADVDQHFGAGKMTFVNDTMPQAYFKKEYDAAEKFQSVVENYLKDAPEHGHLNPMNDPDLEDLLTKIVDADSQAFIASMWGTMKRKGGAVPNDQFEYRMRMAKASDPPTNPMAKFLSKWMYRWRTAVLTFMPRWALNTALGSMVMNSIRGVNLKDYWIAQRLHRSGFMKEDISREGQTRALPTGVNLGHQAQQELMESVTPGHGQGRLANVMADIGIKVPTQQMANGVQNVENFFRRAQFIHNLRREHRLQRDSEGRTIDVGDDESDVALGGLSDGLQEFYDGLLNGRGRMALDPNKSITEALMDPVTIERALKETDKMSYNYSVLGPAERRIVRQFIPFWGWYKFISMAAYRMPVEMPGRMNLIRNLSAIAAEDEKKYGPMPEWVKGGIPLGLDSEGKFKYFSTMGANPLGQVFNPIGPQGPLQGAIQLGQFNPAIQAGLLGFGIDPLSGGQVAISPESGIGSDFFGRMWKNGQSVNPATSGTALQRIGMGLLRSFPEYRIGERAAYGPQYPESIPFVPGSRRQMAPGTGATAGDILMQISGVAPKKTALAGFQSSSAKGAKYAEQQRKTAVKRLKRKNAQ